MQVEHDIASCFMLALQKKKDKNFDAHKEMEDVTQNN